MAQIDGFPDGWEIVRVDKADPNAPWKEVGKYYGIEPEEVWWKSAYDTEEDALEHARTRLAVVEGKNKTA